MTKKEWQACLQNEGFGDCWPEIERELQPEILLTSVLQKQDDIPVGNNKRGGEPDLPEFPSWPAYQIRGVSGMHNTSKPMTFLMQLRCDVLKPFATSTPFPETGLLSFFLAIDQGRLVRNEYDMPLFRILYTSHSSNALVRTKFPKGLYHLNKLAPGTIKLERSYGIGFDLLSSIIDDKFGFLQEQYEKLLQWHEQELCDFESHKIFGFPTAKEMDVFDECRLLTGRMTDKRQRKQEMYSKRLEIPEAEYGTPVSQGGCAKPKATVPTDSGMTSSVSNHDDWILLLKYELDEPGDLVREEAGRLYFMIRRSDLAACRFDESVVIHEDETRDFACLIKNGSATKFMGKK